MPNQSRKVKPLFYIETKKRKPLFVLTPPTKQKPLLSRFENDEDMNFIMDTYQSGLSPFPMDERECKARQAMLKRIARKRKPHVVPILEQIENIIERNKQGKLDTQTAMHQLLKISEKHSHPALHQGILSKIGMMAPQGRPQRSLGIFALEQKPRPNLSDFLKSNNKNKKGKATGWDPWRDDHPLATFIKTAKAEEMVVKVKSRKVMGDYIALHGKLGQSELPIHLRHKIPKNQIWIRSDVYKNPVRRKRILEGHEQFEINLMVEKHMPYKKAHRAAEKNERIENPVAKFFDTTAKKSKGKGWDPWRDEHPLAKAMKQQNKKKRRK